VEGNGNARGRSGGCVIDIPWYLYNNMPITHGYANGNQNYPFRNMLFVDGHVELLTPEQSVRNDFKEYQFYWTGGFIYPLGMWTRAAND